MFAEQLPVVGAEASEIHEAAGIGRGLHALRFTGEHHPARALESVSPEKRRRSDTGHLDECVLHLSRTYSGRAAKVFQREIFTRQLPCQIPRLQNNP